VCDIGWDNKDAQVVCKQLGFTTGNATKGTSSRSLPTLMGSVNCTGTETNLKDCQLTDFNQDHQCVNRDTRAAIICSKDLGLCLVSGPYVIFRLSSQIELMMYEKVSSRE